MKALIALGLFFGFSGLAEAGIYTLNLPGVTGSSEVECAENLAALARIIERELPATIKEVRCRYRDFSRGGYEGQVSYDADRALPASMVQQDRLYFGAGSFAACEESRSARAALYFRATGQRPSLQYCSPKGYLYLQSLQSSHVKPRRWYSHVHGKYVLADVWIDDPDIFVNDLQRAIQPLVMLIDRVRLRGSSVLVDYFATEPLVLEFVAVTGYRDVEECRGASAEFAGLMEIFGGNPLVQRCYASESYPDPERQLSTLVQSRSGVFYDQVRRIYGEKVPQFYNSLQDCEDDVSSQRRRALKSSVEFFGHTCSRIEDSFGYQMVIYRR